MGGRQFNSENRVNQPKPENETETNFGNDATKNLLHTITFAKIQLSDTQLSERNYI